MKLYICFGTGGNDHHACAKAFRALENAGHEPDLVKVYGSGFLPKLMQTKGRRAIKQKTGKYFTPVLELDDGSIIYPSEKIKEWAESHPQSKN